MVPPPKMVGSGDGIAVRKAYNPSHGVRTYTARRGVRRSVTSGDAAAWSAARRRVSGRIAVAAPAGGALAPDLSEGDRLMHLAETPALVADEPMLMWRRAQAHAREAYERWRRDRDAAGFAAYRAAQDLADWAQDELARCAYSPDRST
jgi:hypothetical protein